MAKTQITIPLFVAHLGCPHQCAFCNQYKTSGFTEIPSAENIHEIVLRYRNSMPPGITRVELAFFGGSFTGIDHNTQISLLDAASTLKKESLINGIRLSTRPDYINNAILERLAKYKVDTVELGIQSFHDNVLYQSNRGHTVNDSLQAVALLKNHGFNVVIQLMPGLPADTHETSLESVHRALSLKPAGIRIYPTVVIKNTQLHEMYTQKQYTPLSLEQAITTCKEMYHACCNSQVPVIRMGIHPLKPEQLHNIIAGPYHPSFGFMVKARLKRDIMETALLSFIKNDQGPDATRAVHLVIPEKNKEEYIGSNKENISFLAQKFSCECHYSISNSISEVEIQRA